jgi:cGMP-dependent protein kinase
MEYVKGFELFDIIREIGIVPKVTGRFYMSSLVLSIEYIHLKNIIYRDLKPENVMVENDGHLKLIDMGTAKKLTSNKGFRTFTMIGTPHYMAPEVMHGKGYTFAADIWSLGVVLYEFLCGELPFANKLEEPHEIHKCIV